jgi:N-acyl-D-amino-acid deacylase
MRIAVIALWAVPIVSMAQDYDVIIRNARVIDGTGAPWSRADVAVKNGRIVAIGELSSSPARRTISANGRVLTPGFIDIHTHAERREFRPGIEDLPDALNFLMDGVTTIFTGNCGNSPTDLASWFQARAASGIGPNIASLAGHGSIRRAVMGTDERRPTSDELTRMEALMEQAMRDGAYGVSTGLIYVPGTYADTDEIVALAKVAARFGGVYSSHVRDEGNGVMAAVTEAAQVGRQAGITVQISHLKVASKRLWGESDRLLALLDQFRREGVDVVADQYPYDQASTQLETTLPAWALAGGPEKLKQRLSDLTARARIVEEMEETVRQQGFPDYSFATVSSCAFDRSLEGKTISEINRLRGRGPTLKDEIATILDLVPKGTMQMVLHWMNEQDVERIIQNSNIAVASDGYVIAFGEGVPHPRSYGTRARVLAHYVRDRKVLALEEAVRRMTSLPARTFRLKDRGLIKVGFAADMLLFDPAKVQDASTFAKPHQYSRGFDFVLVNGHLVIEDGKHTHMRPGQLLRRQ